MAEGVVHVECVQQKRSAAGLSELLSSVLLFLVKDVQSAVAGSSLDFSADSLLSHNLEEMHIAPLGDAAASPRLLLDFAALASASRLEVHVYQLNEDGPAEEYDEQEDTSSAVQWLLPCREFHRLWENLVYDSCIKQELLDFARTTLRFSDCGVDPHVVAWNRVILLHGPPGTGKTSLCKALAQKLTVRLADRFTHGQLIEINSHSLFSKWFSESGKLVGKMFANIRELISNEDGFVCVLIDEVESLAAARKAAANGAEPSDAIRVVNAVLTQIDQLKSHKNVLILTTSNITGAIDLAFVDRADVKIYIAPPSEKARYIILASCLRELIRVGLLADDHSIADYSTLQLLGTARNETARASMKLLDIARRCEGLGGRTLRKLPFLAHAFFCASAGLGMPIDLYLDALEQAVAKELQSRAHLAADNGLQP